MSGEQFVAQVIRDAIADGRFEIARAVLNHARDTLPARTYRELKSLIDSCPVFGDGDENKKVGGNGCES
jgi:hypothetical protein